MSKSSRRTLIERAEKIFEIINYEDQSIPKSYLYKAGLNSVTAEKWLELIIFIQNQPKIRLVKTNKTTIIEKLEKKFSQMSLKFFLDENQPIDKRMRSLEAYASSVLVQERLGKTEGKATRTL
jgi:hypothetical protein